MEQNSEDNTVIDARGNKAEIKHPTNKSSKRNYIIFGIVLLVICVGYFCSSNINFYAGGYSVESIILANEFEADGKPVNGKNKTVFAPTDKIIGAAISTSGIDATIGTTWYYEDTLILELFDRTSDNYIVMYMENGKNQTFPIGEYRVEVHIGRNSSPLETIRFTVEETELVVVPAYPTPEGHEDIEKAVFAEVPFVFDETWVVDGEDWQINEVKIVFLNNLELLAVVAETDLDLSAFSEEALENLTKPVAKYAIDNGYLEQARQIEINGETYALTEKLAVTLVDPNRTGQGNRSVFDMEYLVESE